MSWNVRLLILKVIESVNWLWVVPVELFIPVGVKVIWNVNHVLVHSEFLEIHLQVWLNWLLTFVGSTCRCELIERSFLWRLWVLAHVQLNLNGLQRLLIRSWVILHSFVWLLLSVSLIWRLWRLLWLRLW
jgi:hypothetical protein